MDIKALSGVQRTKEFLGKSVKKQNPNIILDIFREDSNYKTFGVKETSEISDNIIKKLLKKGYSWNTIDSCTDRGRAVDLNLLNPITGKLMIGSSSGTAINVLYGLNTVGVGTDGGGSVLGPAIGLNLYSVLLSGVGLKGRTNKKSTDSIEFTPGVGFITQDFTELEKVCEIFLTEPQEIIKKCCVIDLDIECYGKLKKGYEINILEKQEKLYERDIMIEFLKNTFKSYSALIYLEKDVELYGLGDSVFGVMGEKAKEIQKNSNKGFLKVLNMLNCSAITIPTGDIGSAIVIVVPEGEIYLKSLLEISKVLNEDKRPKLYREYFLNYPLKEIDNRDFKIWREND
ncbi:amidase family protein (plasmid) [Cetobacterium somerae]|uniref:amidase family protein n=1 Tax=Cetobacterium somerae TaxID=188913 RepID=UPI001F051BFC|nr:amidase family protein [Cetobacterium somerae]UPO98561.1 amidase family protein [Cetobacterium somerae]